jgi:FkbM family methyltransferase
MCLTFHGVKMAILESLHHAVRTNPFLGRLALRSIPNICWYCTVRDIGVMNINLRKNRSYWLRDPIEGEMFVLGAMRQLIRPGDVAFDVGANIGLHVRFLVQRFGAQKVIAFEPISENVALLKKNLEIGHCEGRVEVVRLALADFDGLDEFQIDDLSSASGSLNVVTRGAASQGRKQYGFTPLTQKVAVAKLDTLMERGDLPIPNLIKVDVEGAEERLLKGALGLLKKHSPNLIIELHGAEPARAVIRLLSEEGYHIFGYLNADQGGIYKEIEAGEIAEIRDQYSLQFCAASRHRETLAMHKDY